MPRINLIDWEPTNGSTLPDKTLLQRALTTRWSYTDEVLILVANNWSCPLTPIAARYTENREDNFDIYLPKWLARYNKEIFGSLYVLGIIYTFARWQGWLN